MPAGVYWKSNSVNTLPVFVRIHNQIIVKVYFNQETKHHIYGLSPNMVVVQQGRTTGVIQSDTNAFGTGNMSIINIHGAYAALF